MANDHYMPKSAFPWQSTRRLDGSITGHLPYQKGNHIKVKLGNNAN